MSTPILQTDPQHLFVGGFLLGENLRFKVQDSMFKIQNLKFKKGSVVMRVSATVPIAIRNTDDTDKKMEKMNDEIRHSPDSYREHGLHR
jgi:hypothetical protein